MPESPHNHFKYVVIGGGIAGTTCVEGLIAQNFENSLANKPLLISPDKLKSLKQIVKHTELLTEYQVVENDSILGQNQYQKEKDFHYIKDYVEKIKPESNQIFLKNFTYKKCIRPTKIELCKMKTKNLSFKKWRAIHSP